MAARFAAVVLAAGASTRMGEENKLLAEVAGAPIVRRVIAALADVRIVERMVVTGADAERVRAVLAGAAVRFVHNPDHAEGIASSIRAGAGALPAAIDGALIVPGDMPWLAREDISAVLDAFDPEGGATVCIPVRNGRRGNPVLWARRHFPALLGLTGDTGGRQLFGRLAAHVRDVPVTGAGVLIDVDTPDALEAARRGPHGPGTPTA